MYNIFKEIITFEDEDFHIGVIFLIFSALTIFSLVLGNNIIIFGGAFILAAFVIWHSKKKGQSELALLYIITGY